MTLSLSLGWLLSFKRSHLLSVYPRPFTVWTQPGIPVISSKHQLHVELCCLVPWLLIVLSSLLHLQYMSHLRVISYFPEAQVHADITIFVLNSNFILLLLSISLVIEKARGTGYSLKCRGLAQ